MSRSSFRFWRRKPERILALGFPMLSSAHIHSSERISGADLISSR